jgi:hypothetical protein
MKTRLKKKKKFKIFSILTCKTKETVIKILNTNIPPNPIKCKLLLPTFSINGIETRVITTIVPPIKGVAFSTLLIPELRNISDE